ATAPSRRAARARRRPEEAVRAHDAHDALVPQARLRPGFRRCAAHRAQEPVQPAAPVAGADQESVGVVMARMVHCVKLGREAEGLDFPPYPGELGKRLYENVSKEAWQGWIRHQTMLVNENRL